ncbi:TPA: hypothetical protein ACGXQD_005686 [Bacillus cereus]|nr:hypothetical protein [Bacillus cereus]HDR8117504.1 hypothetical protein [Bacillus cereus]
MGGLLLAVFQKTKYFFHRAIVQDGIELLESHLNGLQNQRKKSSPKK